MSEYGYSGEFIGYGVELSRKTARTKPRPRGRRGLNRNAILDAAFDMLSQEGESGFSVRKLGLRIGIDPMTVLHHFGSKDELLRAIADRALATVALPHPSNDWRADLRSVAAAYRDLAQRHPRLFHLHFRFHATGPADHASSEVVYRALRRAGLPDADAAGLGLAFYAFLLGYALAEAEGLLRRIDEEDEVELGRARPACLPGNARPHTRLQGARLRCGFPRLGRCLHRRGVIPLSVLIAAPAATDGESGGGTSLALGFASQAPRIERSTRVVTQRVLERHKEKGAAIGAPEVGSVFWGSSEAPRRRP